MGILSGVGTAVPYSVQAFTVTITGQYIAEQSTPGHDGYMFIYTGAFDPNAPLTNLKNGDDDYTGAFTILPGSGTGLDASRIAAGDASNYVADHVYFAGTVYYAVTTGFDNTDAGAFTAGVGGGPGDVTAVPEPATAVTVLAGLACLAFLRRKRAA